MSHTHTPRGMLHIHSCVSVFDWGVWVWCRSCGSEHIMAVPWPPKIPLSGCLHTINMPNFSHCHTHQVYNHMSVFDWGVRLLRIKTKSMHIDRYLIIMMKSHKVWTYCERHILRTTSENTTTISRNKLQLTVVCSSFMMVTDWHLWGTAATAHIIRTNVDSSSHPRNTSTTETATETSTTEIHVLTRSKKNNVPMWHDDSCVLASPQIMSCNCYHVLSETMAISFSQWQWILSRMVFAQKIIFKSGIIDSRPVQNIGQLVWKRLLYSRNTKFLECWINTTSYCIWNDYIGHYPYVYQENGTREMRISNR